MSATGYHKGFFTILSSLRAKIDTLFKKQSQCVLRPSKGLFSFFCNYRIAFFGNETSAPY